MKFLLALCALATLAAPAAVEARRTHYQQTTTYSSGRYYTARSGHRVSGPVRADRAPAGASARCGDGTWSFSESRRGTCSHHGGVASWL
ncbi:DUF3761 domain-containing protein [Sphingomonas antarctica]|uniref:DUF3761 domain-containing protein n=1 Tax=Sphingomonas antarctica TaxID=2040274 RepID=UPI0039EAED86